MGNSDKIVIGFYKGIIKSASPIALLGCCNNNYFEGDLYDLSLGNWDINSKWELRQKYNTIICTRCAYFAKDPEDFIKRCYGGLNDNGFLYVDWGFGDHWRFNAFKVGWIKDGEHEWAYKDKNYLWSGIWDEKFLENEQYLLFEKEIKNRGYEGLKAAIFSEIPSLLHLDFIRNYFYVSYNIMTITNPYLQMYIFLTCGKK